MIYLGRVSHIFLYCVITENCTKFHNTSLIKKPKQFMWLFQIRGSAPLTPPCGRLLPSICHMCYFMFNIQFCFRATVLDLIWISCWFQLFATWGCCCCSQSSERLFGFAKLNERSSRIEQPKMNASSPQTRSHVTNDLDNFLIAPVYTPKQSTPKWQLSFFGHVFTLYQRY